MIKEKLRRELGGRCYKRFYLRPVAVASVVVAHFHVLISAYLARGPLLHKVVYEI